MIEKRKRSRGNTEGDSKEVRNKAIFDSLDLKKRTSPYSTVGEQNQCKTILPHETRWHQGTRKVARVRSFFSRLGVFGEWR